MIFSLIFIGRLIVFFSRVLNLGNGGTWPGEIALKLNPSILSFFTSQLNKGIILVAGTNGKTTTSLLIKNILIDSGISKDRIIHNDSGANLINGLVSAFIQKAGLNGKISADWAVLEVDENSLPAVISNKPIKLIIVLLNLFRDQLDRYGEVDAIAHKWKKALQKLTLNATLILNTDDPQISFLGKDVKSKVRYFGLNQKEKFLEIPEHATDSIYCPNCTERLFYEGIYFSHLGIWCCLRCGLKREDVTEEKIFTSLPGLYNLYNIQAAYFVGKSLNLTPENIKKSISRFNPAFGRAEEININGKKIKILLSKNPAGFNATLRTVKDLNPKVILLVLNDRIPDGRDVSWIWDVDFEMIPGNTKFICSGDRAYDSGLRIKYSLKSQKSIHRKTSEQEVKSQNDKLKFKIIENLNEAIANGLTEMKENETLYILATYSAMLDVRKILTGKKIL